jgi:hypothetical protein
MRVCLTHPLKKKIMRGGADDEQQPIIFIINKFHIKNIKNYFQIVILLIYYF